MRTGTKKVCNFIHVINISSPRVADSHTFKQDHIRNSSYLGEKRGKFEASYLTRKPEKPQLAKAIDDYACSLLDEAVTNEVPQTESYVLDGSSKVQWTKGSTYGAIADCYVDFTLRNYGMATVVFDGYHDEPSVKDSTHQRRQQKNHPKVSFTPTTVFTGKKEEFLSQGSNKQGLINMISDRLREKGCKVMNAEGDADYDIVQAAIALSEYKTTALIGEDTDLLILLLHHMDSHKKTLYFRSDKKSKEQRVYNINTLKECLGQQLCSQLLFIHAFTGCDTTSRVFGMGKKPFFQKVAKGDEQLKSCPLAFTKPGQTVDTIEQHGNQSMVLLFSGKQTDYLASLRHSVFKKKVVSASSFVAPARLPPAASATKLHSLRAYYQIMTWLGLKSNLDATDWGWKIEDNQFAPVMTAKNPAPDNLLKIVAWCHDVTTNNHVLFTDLSENTVLYKQIQFSTKKFQKVCIYGFLLKTDKSKDFSHLTKGITDAVPPPNHATLNIEDGNATFYCMRDDPTSFK
ncbi:hypothetical protein GQR58_001251 [Nymphon striatum]|nr:hypothetical protein GQR58_001251 [Nymphon striatum]